MTIDELAEDYSPPVIAETTKNLRQMSVEEAVMELDLTQAEVVVFRHAGHGGLNVVYRRADGNIGWIDPALQRQLGARTASPTSTRDILMELADILSEESVLVCTDIKTKHDVLVQARRKGREADRPVRRRDLRGAERPRSAGLDRPRQRHRHSARQVRRR